MTSAEVVSKPSKRFRRRDAVIQTAIEIINEKGLKGMTLAEVAARMKIVPTGVAYYFGRKENLAATCFLKTIEVFNGLITEAACAPTPRERMRALLQAYARFNIDVIEGRRSPVVLFNDARALADPSVNAEYIKMYRQFRAMIAGSPDEEHDHLELNARAHLALSLFFWSRGVFQIYDPEYFPEVADRILDIMTDGLSASAERWSTSPLLLPDDESARGDASPERFLKAATALINEQGYGGASVEKISARLNVTKGSFYHHNEAKYDLVAECFKRTLRIMRSTQRAADRAANNGFENLYLSASTLIDYQMSEKGPLLSIQAVTSVPEPIRGNLLRQFGRISSRYALIASGGMSDGSIRPVDQHIAAQMVWAMINATAELSLWAPGITAQNVDEVYVRQLFRGLFRAEARAPASRPG